MCQSLVAIIFMHVFLILITYFAQFSTRVGIDMVVDSCLVLAFSNAQQTVSAYYGMTSDQLMLKQSLNELIERRLQGTSRVRARSGHQIFIATFHLRISFSALILSITPPPRTRYWLNETGRIFKKRRVTFFFDKNTSPGRSLNQ